jgi:hypothetical protein
MAAAQPVKPIVLLAEMRAGQSVSAGAHQCAFRIEVVQRRLRSFRFIVHPHPPQFQNSQNKLMRSHEMGACFRQLLDKGEKARAIFGYRLPPALPAEIPASNLTPVSDGVRPAKISPTVEPGGEGRYLSVLSCDLVGSTSISAR